MQDWAQAPVRALAYVGDAVYELHIRERMIQDGGNVNALHSATVPLVSATGQANLARKLLPILTESEAAIFRRARNHKLSGPRKVPPDQYQLSTAFEATLGYLYLKPDRDRLKELLTVIDSIHKEDSHGA